MHRIKKFLKSLSVLLPARRCELLLYEILAALERNAVRTNQIILSQSAPDFIFQLTSAQKMTNGEVAKMYAPNAGEDYIQTIIATRHDFFSNAALEATRKWVKPGAHILDIGGNIGNHSIFWGGVIGVARIYNFEPVASIFSIQAKNIMINELGDIVKAFPLALGEKPGRGRISIPDEQNMGSVRILEDVHGACEMESLDSLLEAGVFRESSSISFVKIDVEGFESAVLRGGEKFFTHYKPVILVEVFERKKTEVFSILADFGYCLVERLEDHDYLFAQNQ